jgi:hypothetical protein
MANMPVLIRIAEPGESDPPAYIGAGADYYCGTINPAAAEVLTHQFTLTNTSGHPVLISGLVPTCECTSAKIISGVNKTQTLPYTVAPQSNVNIQLTIDMAETQPGVMQKAVKVINSIEGANQVPVILQMDGMIAQQITFSPTVLDFGQVQPGSSKSLSLEAVLQKSIVGQHAALELSSSDPSILISLEADGAGAKETLIMPATSDSIVCYVTALPSASIGDHFGFITARMTASSSSGITSSAPEPPIGIEDFRCSVSGQRGP